MLELPILSITIAMPLLSALYIMFGIGYSSSQHKQIYAMYVAILSSILTLIATIYLLIQFNYSNSQYQFVEYYNWIYSIGLAFQLGVDGISIFFVFLTALLTLICIISSAFTIKKYVKEFIVCFLLLESFCIGVFSSINLLLFYFFFEAILIPMYIIIGIWGGENKLYATVKFFIYTFTGSVLFLAFLIFAYIEFNSFDMLYLTYMMPNLNIDIQKILWIITFIAFAIKVPMPPFHTWLPDAHVQAPTAGSVILAGILLKIGAYAFLRVSLPMLPEASFEFQNYVLILSVISVIYASFVALEQTDMKKMIAYSSIAHMGYVTGGIFSLKISGINGAIFQMISHGLISSALFLIVGMLYERHHTKEINKYGGVADTMPKLSVLFMIIMLGSIGLPATSGFIGEFMSIVGIFKANSVAAICISFGIILGAIYMLTLYKNIMLGKVEDPEILRFSDLRPYEFIPLLTLAIMIIYFGICPNSILDIINSSTIKISDIYNVMNDYRG
ncbi:MAG: NuoM family protein [Rickettsiaceae bacterium]